MHLWRCLLVLAALTVSGWACSQQSVPAVKPKVMVLIVFDQLRGDYLARWADLYPEGGFKRLMSEGLWFTNCHYPYACTMTGPGHASLLTGCSPDRHGIVMNEWFDRSLGKEVYCSTTDRYEKVYSVPPPPADRREKETRKGGTPERMLADGVSDWLKDQTDGKAKVVAISLKDRSACLPGGKKADACYWFDSKTGSFVTSTYYRDRCHDWVSSFNETGAAKKWLGQTWTRSRADVDYEKYSGPDDVPSETAGIDKKMGRAFPHSLSVGKSKPDKEYYEEVTCSPFGNDLLLEFGERAFAEMKLGQRQQTDLFSISFSANDIVGHSFGPDSQEVLDITLNADRCVAKLLQMLDSKVGSGQYIVALSADHGICPIPEISAAKGLDARRLNPADLQSQVEDFLDSKYGKDEQKPSKWIDDDAFPWVYLNHRKLAARQLEPQNVATELVQWVKRQDWALTAYTRSDMERVHEKSDAITKSMKKAYHPDRCGDLGLVLKPYYLSTEYPTGTTHGSPHAYDTHVPLVFFGTGIPAKKSDEPITPQAIAAVFAHSAGLTPAKTLEASVPSLITAASKR